MTFPLNLRKQLRKTIRKPSALIHQARAKDKPRTRQQSNSLQTTGWRARFAL